MSDTPRTDAGEGMEAARQLERDLDPHTCLALRPLIDAGNAAKKERDEYNMWAVRIAITLGVSCSNFRAEDVGSQYAELRSRITDALDSTLANVLSRPHGGKDHA